MDLADSVQNSLRNWGSHPVFVEIAPGRPDRVVHSRDLMKMISDAAAVFSKMGIGENAPVPLFLENSIEFPVAFLALLSLKAIPVMVKLEYRSIELGEIFANLDPDVLISEKAHLDVLAPWLEGKNVVVREAGKWRLAQAGGPIRSIEVPDDVATINYTYRGYGYPLGSMAPHSQYFHGAQIVQIGLESRPGDKMLCILPFSHIFTLVGCLILPLIYKLTGIISLTMNPRILFEIIENRSVNYVLSIPEIFALLYRIGTPGKDYPSLAAILTGGSLMTKDQALAYTDAFGVDVLHGYGLTEFTPVTGNQRSNLRAGTVGPLGIDLEYADRNGEITVKSPDLTRGYYRRDRETKEAFENGFFRTGDKGRMEDGHMVFESEMKRTRKVNGNMVDLTEVETVIASFPGMDRYSLTHADGILSAVVTFSDKNENKLDELRRYLKKRIAIYKIPRLTVAADM